MNQNNRIFFEHFFTKIVHFLKAGGASSSCRRDQDEREDESTGVEIWGQFGYARANQKKIPLYWSVNYYNKVCSNCVRCRRIIIVSVEKIRACLIFSSARSAPARVVFKFDYFRIVRVDLSRVFAKYIRIIIADGRYA